MAPTVTFRTMSSLAMLRSASSISDFDFLDLEKSEVDECAYNIRGFRPQKDFDFLSGAAEKSPQFDDVVFKSHRIIQGDPPKRQVECKRLARLALPIVIIYVFEILPVVISIMLVGRIDSPLTTEYVDGATLSSMVISLSGEAIGVGLATALDTLCSQAHGAGQPKKIGVSFQTGLLVLAVAYVPVFVVNWFTEDILLLIRQPDEVAELAGRFSRLLLPGLPFMFLYELLKKVLQAQNIVAPLVWIALLSNVVNLGIGAYLTWHTSLGYDGAAVARTVANIVLPLATIPYFLWKPERFHMWWPGWQPKAALQHVRVFLELGVPGMLMVVVEYLSYDIVAVLVAYLPNSVVAISVHSVLWNIANVAFRLYMGVAVATNVIVGNYVGSGLTDHARMVSNIGMAVSMGISVAVVTIIAAAHTELPKLFVSDHEAIDMAASALLSLIPFELLDAINCVMQGIFRGTGRQTFAAIVNLLSLFVIGLPCRFVFAFTFDMGVEGFWLGMAAGYAVCVAASLVKIWRTDWAAMSEQAKQRIDG